MRGLTPEKVNHKIGYWLVFGRIRTLKINEVGQ